MNGRLFALLLAPAVLALPAAASQAAPCYQEAQGDPVMTCGGGTQGNSADFATNCTYVVGPPVQVEVACPGMWVSTASDTETQAEACGRFGLQPANASGQICASGERRPLVGTGFDSIRYKYGTWGSPGPGGSVNEARTFTFTSGGGGGHNGNPTPVKTTTIVRDYCWASGQKRDYDITDVTVAFYCGSP